MNELKTYNNKKILTPRMKKLMNNKDARELLQEEINESVLRVNQAKFGHSLHDILPDHPNSFYLPNKSKYVPTLSKFNSINKSILNKKSSLSVNKSNFGILAQ